MSHSASRFQVDAPGAFSLPAAVSFLQGFAPAGYAVEAFEQLSLAFVAEIVGYAEKRFPLRRSAA